ncbi:hypothetical protein PENTCL1PPCAC_3111, partial [Pristionchus entomophagus]
LLFPVNSNGYSNGHAANGVCVRSASHAGSWYTKNARDLNKELRDWLAAAGEPMTERGARAIIAPHAGYSYCGATAAYAFKQIVPDKIRRIFILGPSHVVCLNGCALTTCAKYRTPLGDLNVDREITEELYATGHFEWMGRQDEEREHSIEMQLPFLAKVMERQPADSYTVVPVLVGSLSGNKQATYGQLFARYIEDPHSLFVISSDFCHWGGRFHFSPYDPSSATPIFEQIANMDKQGMEAISRLQPSHFNEYLKRTQNTICGRNPILVLLQAAEHFRQANNHTHEFQFLRYSQSNQVRSPSDSSVSYAAGALFIHPN